MTDRVLIDARWIIKVGSFLCILLKKSVAVLPPRDRILFPEIVCEYSLERARPGSKMVAGL